MSEENDNWLRICHDAHRLITKRFPFHAPHLSTNSSISLKKYNVKIVAMGFKKKIAFKTLLFENGQQTVKNVRKRKNERYPS